MDEILLRPTSEILLLPDGRYCVSEALFRKYLRQQYDWRVRRKQTGKVKRLQLYWLNRPITLLGLVRDDFYTTLAGQQAALAQQVIRQFDVYESVDVSTQPPTLAGKFVLTE